MTRDRDCSALCLSTIIGTIETAARTKICAQITNPNSIGLPSMFRRGYGIHGDPVVPVARIGQFLDFRLAANLDAGAAASGSRELTEETPHGYGNGERVSARRADRSRPAVAVAMAADPNDEFARARAPAASR